MSLAEWLTQPQTHFESWNLEAKKRENTIHFNGHSVNSELLFQTVCSVNLLSVHGDVSDWCVQFDLTNEKKERVNFPSKNWVAPMMEPEEVEMLVSLPKLALETGCRETRGKEDTDDTPTNIL